MSTAPLRRVLVAGIGNIFFSDDGFGVEVAARLSQIAMPPGVRVVEFGIRGLHLAYEMLEQRYDDVIFIDALAQDNPPGTVVLFEPSAEEIARTTPDPHAMNPATVLALLRSLGGTMPHVLVVGCEPGNLEPGMGLSEVVQEAVEPAVRRIVALVEGASPGLEVRMMADH